MANAISRALNIGLHRSAIYLTIARKPSLSPATIALRALRVASALTLLSIAPARADAADAVTADALVGANSVPGGTAASAADASADGLFRSGRDAMQRGDYELACSRFAESDRLEPSPGAKLNLALCEEQLRHLTRAWRYLQEAIRELPDGDERAAIAKRHADDLQHQLAFVTITLPPKLAQRSRVKCDGIALSSADLASKIPFDPGHHEIELAVEGHSSRTTEIFLSPGELREISLALDEVSSTRASDSSAGKSHAAVAQRQSHALRSAAWAAEGAAGALAIASITTGVLALDAKHEMNRACSDPDGCSEAGLRAAERGQALARISTASFVGALAAGGLGVLFLLIDGHGSARTAALSLDARDLRWEF